MVVRRRLRPIREAEALRFAREAVTDDARLYARRPSVWVDREDVAHVLRPIDDDGGVGRLAGQGSPARARDDGHPERLTSRDDRDGVVLGLWDDHANGDVPVIGRVGRIEG